MECETGQAHVSQKLSAPQKEFLCSFYICIIPVDIFKFTTIQFRMEEHFPDSYKIYLWSYFNVTKYNNGVLNCFMKFQPK